MINVLKGMLFFAVFAPPLGGVIVGLTMALIDPESGVGFVDLLQVASRFALFSYLFGGLAALVTGAAAGAFRKYLGRLIPCIAIGLLGCALSFMFQYKTAYNWSDVQYSFLAFGAPALVSGTVVSAFFGRKPNNSFNPDALKRAG